MRKPAKRAAKKPAGKIEPKNLAFAVVDAPRLASPKAARLRVAEWLADIARTPAGKRLSRLLDASPKLGNLLAGLAECSPFLWDLASEKPARLLAILESDPAQRLETLLAKAGRAAADADDEDKAMRLLRRMKSEAALLIALADIGGVWPVMRTTNALTALADAAVGAAAKFLLGDAVRRGKLNPPIRRRPNPEAA